MKDAEGSIFCARGIIKLSQKNSDLFWKKIRKTESCWEWSGTLSTKGYGKITIQRAQLLAHRVSFQIHFGMISLKILVCHKCDNPACVRPDHLFTGTQRDNIQDMLSKGRGVSKERHWTNLEPERIKRGDNHYSKLHPEKVPRGGNHYIRKHPEKIRKGEQSVLSKLTGEKVLEIRRLVSEGIPQYEVARRFGIHPRYAWLIVHRKRWAHI